MFIFNDFRRHIKPFIYDDDDDVGGGGVEKAWLMSHLAIQKNLVDSIFHVLVICPDSDL